MCVFNVKSSPHIRGKAFLFKDLFLASRVWVRHCVVNCVSPCIVFDSMISCKKVKGWQYKLALSDDTKMLFRNFSKLLFLARSKRLTCFGISVILRNLDVDNTDLIKAACVVLLRKGDALYRLYSDTYVEPWFVQAINQQEIRDDFTFKPNNFNCALCFLFQNVRVKGNP